MSERKLTNEMKAVLADAICPDAEKEPVAFLKFIRYSSENLPFDTDWNWTIEVYRKFCDIDFDINEITEELAVRVRKVADSNLFAYPTPEPLAIALYDFIVFYNQQKEKV